MLSRNNVTIKAINYRLSRWNAFTRFLDDGRLCVSNMLLSVNYGRSQWDEKNSTFAGVR